MLAGEAPKITDWMQAWGSLAGLVMSTVAVVFTGLLFRHEIRVRREEQRDNEAALARLVVYEFRRVDTTDVDDDGNLIGDVVYIEYRIRNLAASPILDVTFSLLDVEKGVMHPAMTVREVVVSETDVGVDFDPPLEIQEPWELDLLLPVIHFTDANGLQWVRQGTASPVRYFPKKAPGPGKGRLIRIPRPAKSR
ncbi:hypothetical protein [Micromonospora sp. 4G55]|uniref:hypothetical protein n=1 Tax=Micromonospora sp. 4G55 TaxID=2806102 RepID=UPI001A518114|nr:hypothetical protein [Micromonospora sp. 4G55]MBM0259363.1 hypothetical protein [Micromonospora sp. 4G55]